MRLALSLMLTTLCLVGNATADTQFKVYDGPEWPKKELATYNLWNYQKFTAPIQMYTISIGSLDFESKGAIGNVPAAGGQALLLPGRHRAKVSFVDTKGFFPGLMDSRVFPGWYELEFEAKAGMLYAPIFDASQDPNNLLDRLCIAEVPLTKGIGAALRQTRGKPTLVACAAPTLNPRTDRKTWCSSWDGRNARTKLCPRSEIGQ